MTPLLSKICLIFDFALKMAKISLIVVFSLNDPFLKKNLSPKDPIVAV